MYREDLLESTIATVKGYYASLPETMGKVIHMQDGEEIPSMAQIMEDNSGIVDAIKMLDQIVEARGVMPSDYILMSALYAARAVQVQEHLVDCDDCQESLLQTIKRNDRMEVIRKQIKDILGEEDEED